MERWCNRGGAGPGPGAGEGQGSSAAAQHHLRHGCLGDHHRRPRDHDRCHAGKAAHARARRTPHLRLLAMLQASVASLALLRVDSSVCLLLAHTHFPSNPLFFFPCFPLLHRPTFATGMSRTLTTCRGQCETGCTSTPSSPRSTGTLWLTSSPTSLPGTRA